ncbi:hypothetical protein HDU84_008656 [Entophlyctis sp. JEL0112]|nr:hypothetical protein HDU84_008656 [Entophlyctis sp. JEL0112]
MSISHQKSTAHSLTKTAVSVENKYLASTQILTSMTTNSYGMGSSSRSSAFATTIKNISVQSVTKFNKPVDQGTSTSKGGFATYTTETKAYTEESGSKLVSSFTTDTTEKVQTAIIPTTANLINAAITPPAATNFAHISTLVQTSTSQFNIQTAVTLGTTTNQAVGETDVHKTTNSASLILSQAIKSVEFVENAPRVSKVKSSTGIPNHITAAGAEIAKVSMNLKQTSSLGLVDSNLANYGNSEMTSDSENQSGENSNQPEPDQSIPSPDTNFKTKTLVYKPPPPPLMTARNAKTISSATKQIFQTETTIVSSTVRNAVYKAPPPVSIPSKTEQDYKTMNTAKAGPGELYAIHTKSTSSDTESPAEIGGIKKLLYELKKALSIKQEKKPVAGVRVLVDVQLNEKDSSENTEVDLYPIWLVPDPKKIQQINLLDVRSNMPDLLSYPAQPDSARTLFQKIIKQVLDLDTLDLVLDPDLHWIWQMTCQIILQMIWVLFAVQYWGFDVLGAVLSPFSEEELEWHLITYKSWIQDRRLDNLTDA